MFYTNDAKYFTCWHSFIKVELHLIKMNSAHKGRMTKRYSCHKCVSLEDANFFLKFQLEQMRFKYFILKKQKRQCEEYNTYLEEILSTYMAVEKEFEETRLNFTDGRRETEEKKSEKDDTLEPVLMRKNDTYWKCFWCLR